jgi:hypothetical protein
MKAVVHRPRLMVVPGFRRDSSANSSTWHRQVARGAVRRGCLERAAAKCSLNILL